MQMLVTEPALLKVRRMSDDELFEFCGDNSDYRIERTAEGRVIVQWGTDGRTGNRNSRLTAQLGIWADEDGRGAGFDSGTLFLLPNTAMRSPDASWVVLPRLTQLSGEQKEKYLPLCPDFVAELTSPSDRFPAVKEKMEEWMANGCQLGWLIHVKRREVHIYRPKSVEIVTNPQQIVGEGPVEGFILKLDRIWEPGF